MNITLKGGGISYVENEGHDGWNCWGGPVIGPGIPQWGKVENFEFRGDVGLKARKKASDVGL
jgi:hypothetical protein